MPASPRPVLGELDVPQHLLSLAEKGTGPLKIVLPDHEPPDLDGLRTLMARAHDSGRGVAVHAVMASALALTIAGLDTVGSRPDDRIEHAAICDDAAADRLAELGVTVVTQPGLLARHGDRYLAESEPAERALLWRYAGLLRAGVPVVASSDAPYGAANPWATAHAAARRASGRGHVLTPVERVTPWTVVSSMLTKPTELRVERVVEVGAVADLCLLRLPLAQAMSALERSPDNPVAAVFLAGRPVSSAPPEMAGDVGKPVDGSVV